MKSSDIKPRMVFGCESLTSYYFEVEEVTGKLAKGRGWRGCNLKEAPEEVLLAHLVDGTRWRYLETKA